MTKGSFVRIKKTVLEPHERAQNIPSDTVEKPLMMWVKGTLQEDASLGDEVKIKTITGREETGILLDDSMMFEVNYGSFIPEIIELDHYFKSLMDEVNDHE